MTVLFYFFKNVHIPIFAPIIRLIREEKPEWGVFFSAPPNNPAAREGINEEERLRIKEMGAQWLDHPSKISADAAIMADCIPGQLQGHKKIINLGHGLISKGQYYGNSPLIGRENLADVICVPGPWHKAALEKFLYVPIEVTGMSKLDSLFSPFDKSAICAEIGVDPSRPILLWAPIWGYEHS